MTTPTEYSDSCYWDFPPSILGSSPADGTIWQVDDEKLLWEADKSYALAERVFKEKKGTDLQVLCEKAIRASEKVMTLTFIDDVKMNRVIAQNKQMQLRLFGTQVKKKIRYLLPQVHETNPHIADLLAGKFEYVKENIDLAKARGDVPDVLWFCSCILLEKKKAWGKAAGEYDRLANCLSQKGLFDMALRASEEALRLCPKDPSLAYNQGIILSKRAARVFKHGQYGFLASIRDYEKALFVYRTSRAHALKKTTIHSLACKKTAETKELLQKLKRQKALVCFLFNKTLKRVASTFPNNRKIYDGWVLGDNLGIFLWKELQEHLDAAGISVQVMEKCPSLRETNFCRSSDFMQNMSAWEVVHNTNPLLEQIPDLEQVQTPLQLFLKENQGSERPVKIRKMIFCPYGSLLSYFDQTFKLVQVALQISTLSDKKKFEEMADSFKNECLESFQRVFGFDPGEIGQATERTHREPVSAPCKSLKKTIPIDACLLPQHWSPDEKEKEREFLQILSQQFVVQDVYGDGNCGFRSVAKALDPALCSSLTSSAEELKIFYLRNQVVDHLSKNRIRYQDFCIADPKNRNMPVAFEKYLEAMSLSGIYIDQPELSALAEILERPIWVYRRGMVTVSPDGTSKPYDEFRYGDTYRKDPICLYYRPEHYMCLRNR